MMTRQETVLYIGLWDLVCRAHRQGMYTMAVTTCEDSGRVMRYVHVGIGGNILSLDGELNFRGASSAVIPLDPGPALALAESVPTISGNSTRKAVPG